MVDYLGNSTIPMVCEVQTQYPPLNRSATGGLTGTGQQADIQTHGISSVIIQITGTWTATCVVEGSSDFITWNTLNVIKLPDTSTLLSSFTTNGYYSPINIGGYTYIRVRATSYSSGTVQINFSASTAPSVITVNAGPGTFTVDLRRGQTIQFASIDITSLGDNTIVSADGTRKIKVLSYHLVADAAVGVRWKSGSSTNLSGAMSFAINGGIASAVTSPAQGHLLETAVNQALVLNLSLGVGVRGHMSYFLEV